MLKESDYVKIKVTVPVNKAAIVREALGKAGAGKQGNYNYCSSSSATMGRFQPLSGAKPAIGSVGKLEEIPEEMIETICHKDLVAKVIKAVKEVHPYEEPAIDIIPRLEIR